MIRDANREPPNPAGSAPPSEATTRKAERIRAARAGELVWMSAGEAAEYLGEDPANFRKAAARGEFDGYRDIGGTRYRRDELDEWRRGRVG